MSARLVKKIAVGRWWAKRHLFRQAEPVPDAATRETIDSAQSSSSYVLVRDLPDAKLDTKVS